MSDTRKAVSLVYFSFKADRGVSFVVSAPHGSVAVILLQRSRHISHAESNNINIIYKAALFFLRLIDGTLILPLNF